jgi:NAD(P)-dependent dehydrogenase (short-subunit alcohol dehydrogenase family)
MTEAEPTIDEDIYVIAGAGRGIGRAVAVELGKYGATVVVNDLGTGVKGEGESEEPAEETAATIRENGGEAIAHFGDVADLEYTQRLVDDTLEAYGRIDGVANFAGILRSAPIEEMSGRQWDEVVRVHLRGHFALLRNVAAHWIDRPDAEDRSFLGVSSQSSLGHHDQANYAAAKAGILGLVRTAANELYPHGIRVNALFPSGYTRMVRDLPEADRPFGEEVDPEKVAPMVGYLLSDAGSDVTGCTVRAGGDEIGYVTDPELARVGYRDGGWTFEAVCERFPTITDGIDLERPETLVSDKYGLDAEGGDR